MEHVQLVLEELAIVDAGHWRPNAEVFFQSDRVARVLRGRIESMLLNRASEAE